MVHALASRKRLVAASNIVALARYAAGGSLGFPETGHDDGAVHLHDAGMRRVRMIWALSDTPTPMPMPVASAIGMALSAVLVHGQN